MVKFLKQCSINDRIRIVLSLILLICVTNFFIVDCAIVRNLEGLTKPDNSYITFILIVAASIVNVIPIFFKKLSFLVVITTLLISFGIGVHFYLAAFALADISTGVPFFTNSVENAVLISTLYLIYLGLFVLCDIGCIILAFRKD